MVYRKPLMGKEDKIVDSKIMIVFRAPHIYIDFSIISNIIVEKEYIVCG